MLRVEVLLRPLYVRTSSNQGTHRANADTITPAQYQPRSASSLIGSSFPFREGLYTPLPILRGVFVCNPNWVAALLNFLPAQGMSDAVA
jgi:hypothetical protein